MNSKERFQRTLARQTVDHPASWLGMPDAASLPALFAYFGARDVAELSLAVGDDVYAVEPPYHSETANAIYAAFDWYGKGSVDAHNRTLSTPGCFADAEDEDEVNAFAWPDPERYMDVDEIDRRLRAIPEDRGSIALMWSAHFQDTCAAFGMENCLVNMLVNPELVHAVNERVLSFYLRANRIFYERAKGKLDAVLIGNDMGSQRGLMLSPELVRAFVLPGCRRLTEQAHEYGFKVIYHSCGSIAAIIGDLIAAGVDAIHPIQALAAGMSAEDLHAHFGSLVSFVGGVDTQRLLSHGSPEEVRARVAALRTLFPTGLVISPSHEAVLPDVPPENIDAMVKAVRV